MIEKLYIVKLWRTSKFLFASILLFVIGQAFFTYKGILNFPFFPFEMYGHPTSKTEEIGLTEVYVNNHLLDYTSLPDWTEGTILNTSKFYNRYQTGNNWAMKAWNTRFGRPDTDFKKLIYYRLVPSEAQIATYPQWLADYIAEQAQISADSVRIFKKYYHYDNQRLVPTGKETVLLDYRR